GQCRFCNRRLSHYQHTVLLNRSDNPGDLHSFPTRRSSDLSRRSRRASLEMVDTVTATSLRRGLLRREQHGLHAVGFGGVPRRFQDRKSTRLNSSHVSISYAVFCLKKKTHIHKHHTL